MAALTCNARSTGRGSLWAAYESTADISSGHRVGRAGAATARTANRPTPWSCSRHEYRTSAFDIARRMRSTKGGMLPMEKRLEKTVPSLDFLTGSPVTLSTCRPST
eukprot:3718260-Rhodomonas_salina.2